MRPLSLGHVHLKVRDLERSIGFYQRVAGLQITEKTGGFAFLTDGPTHHSLALQALGEGAPGPVPFGVGLYHLAFEVPDTESLLAVWDLEKEVGPMIGVDHGISWALYFEDPDGNGVEVYLDRRAALTDREGWNGRSTRLSRDRVRELGLVQKSG